MSSNKWKHWIFDCARASTIGCLLIALGPSIGACDDAREREEQTNEAEASDSANVHEQLNLLLRLMEDGKETPETVELFKRSLGSLIVASERDELGYEREVTEFEATAIADGKEQAGIVAKLAQSLSRASKTQILEAVLPYLTKSDDPTRRAVSMTLSRIEDGYGDRPPDFSAYQTYLAATLRAGDELNSGLVNHMFSRSPGQALQTFTMVVYQDERRKPFLWAQHVVDDALWKRQYGFAPPKEPDAEVTEQLEKMARRDEFWARLYAAEIIRQHPEFGNNELVKRLRADSHPLVQQTAGEIRLPKAN